MQNREIESENPYEIVTEIVTINGSDITIVKNILTIEVSRCIIQVKKRDPY